MMKELLKNNLTHMSVLPEIDEQFLLTEAFSSLLHFRVN